MTAPKPWSRRRFFLIALFGLVILLAHLQSRYRFPYGYKPARFPMVMAALRLYTMDHDGAFPNVKNDPYASLAALYPEYLTDASFLAGISGNEAETPRLVTSGRPLNTQASSWIYWPGYNESNNPALAILWENAEGVSFNGARRSGHIVGYCDGSFRQIGADQWEDFLQQQKRLRGK